MAVGRPLLKGGEADVAKTAVRGTAVFGVFGSFAVHTLHRCVLAARMAPGRLTQLSGIRNGRIVL